MSSCLKPGSKQKFANNARSHKAAQVSTRSWPLRSYNALQGQVLFVTHGRQQHHRSWIALEPWSPWSLQCWVELELEPESL